jgi:hypothetical protein
MENTLVDLTLGKREASNNFNGYFDDFRIYNKSLSPDQITLIYQGRDDKIHFNETTVGDVWQACVTPNDGYRDGVENCSNTLTIRNAPPATTNVVLNSTYGTNYTNENLTVYYNTTDVDGNNLTNITNWYLNGTSIALLNMPFEANVAQNMSTWTKDYSSRNNHGTVSGATWNATGGYYGKGAYNFNGASTLINCTFKEDWEIQQGTYSAWFKTSTAGQYQFFVDTFSFVASDTAGALLGIHNNNSIRFDVYGTGGDAAIYGPSVTDGNWHHAAGTFADGVTKLYLDGAQVSSGSYSGSVQYPAGTNTDLILGAETYGSTITAYLTGVLDEVRVYNRSLTADQVRLLWQNRTDRIHFNETSVGDVWQACVTPNDGTEDGAENCSNTLTIISSPITVSQIDPLQNWVLNDTIKFECNASATTALINASLFHNASGSWTRAAYKTISGTSAVFEFNISGFTNGQRFNWTCEACIASGCVNSSSRNITIDLTRPGVGFAVQTPANVRNTTFYNWAYVNVSTSDTSNMSAFIDFNRTLVGWWRFENNTNDSGTYMNNGTCTEGSTCPETWTGIRGKGYNFDGGNDLVNIGNDSKLQLLNEATISFWAKADREYPSDSESTAFRPLFAKDGGGGAGQQSYYLDWYGTNSTRTFRARMGNAVGSIGFTISDFDFNNDWNNVVFMWNASHLMLYINGAPQTPIVRDRSPVVLPDPARIGYGFGFYWDGMIDEFMIHERALSPDEVNATYQNHLKTLFRNFTGLLSGTVNYTAKAVDMAGNINGTEHRNYSVNWLPNVSNLVIDSTGGNNYTTDNISISYTTQDGDNDHVKNITTWYVNGSSIAVLNMPFESNTQLNMSIWTKDYSGRNNSGNINNASWNATGGYDSRGAYTFNGSSSYVSLGDASSNKVWRGITGFAVSFWFKNIKDSDQLATSEFMISKDPSSGSSNRFMYVGIASSLDRIYAVVQSPDGGSASDCISTTYPKANTWYHVVYQYDVNSGSQLYINGTLEDSDPSHFTINTDNAYNTEIAAINSGQFAFNGTIDEVRIFNRTLTADQIMLLYQNQTDKIHFNETSVGDTWHACVTPNDGMEDGIEQCSADLTVEEYTPCKVISAAGTYVLAENAFGAPKFINGVADVDKACIVINANNVDFSCGGYNISNSGIGSVTNAAAIIVKGQNDLARTNVTIKDCANISGYKVGVYIHNSTRDYVRNVTVHNASGPAFFANSTTESSFTDTRAIIASLGYTVRQSTGINITGGIARNTTEAAYKIVLDSNRTLIKDSIAYANSRDLLVDYTDGTKTGLLTVSNLTLYPPTGISANYTEVYLVDEVESPVLYTVNFTRNTTAWPTNKVSFRDKYLDLTQQIGSSYMGTVTFKWKDSELLGYDEDYFQLWKFSQDTWEPLNTTPNTATNSISISNFLPASIYAVGEDKANNEPSVDSLVLNATDYPANRTNANLTLWPVGVTDPDSQPVKLYYTWRINNTPMTVLNLPLSYKAEYSSDQQTIYEYSGYSNTAKLGNNTPGDVHEPIYDKNDGYDSFGAYIFDGTDDFITVPNSASMYAVNTTGTFEAWVRPANCVGQSAGICTIADLRGTGGGGLLIFYYESTGSIAAQYGNGTNLATVYTGAAGFGSWYHYAAVWNSTGFYTYLNGQYQNTGTMRPNISDAQSSMYVGSHGGTTRYFNGTISDVKLYRRPLSPQQIASNYNGGAGRYNLTVKEETIKHQFWNASVTPVDYRGKSGSTVWSNTLEIMNTPPTNATLSVPTNNNSTITTRTPEFNWSASSDDDNDNITYRLNLTSPCYAAISYSGLTETNKTPDQELHTSDECGVTPLWYNWTVESYDGEAYNTSAKRNFSIMPVIVFGLDPSTVDFGDMILGASDDSTDGTPAPYILENNGTVFADITNITADTNLWIRSPSPTEMFQLKVSDYEHGSINLSGSAVDWTNVSTSNITIIERLNYSRTNNSARIDFRLTVPVDEPAGPKSVTLTLYGAQT